MQETIERAWAEVDLDAIAHNMNEIRKITSPNAKIMAVVKADAYGHGFLQVAKTLINNGANSLAVAVMDEAKQLRSRGIEVPILVLGKASKEQAEDFIDFDVMPSVFDYELAKTISDVAVEKDKDAKIHIKIDTGMSRVGFVYHNEDDNGVIDEIAKISKLPNIEIEGIFSHFACADEIGSSYTNLQFKRFITLCNKLDDFNVKINVKHICNSAGIIMQPEMHLDMVRPGIILYGLYPSDEVDKTKIELKPAMTLKAKITRIRTIEENTGVSYGNIYTTNKKTKIATIPIGYADGYLRCLANKAKMLAKEKIVDVIGRICMDQCMIDVTNVNNINEGDEVTIFGNGQITADTLADWMNSINYEVVCLIGKRIPRVYLSGGKAVRVLNYIV